MKMIHEVTVVMLGLFKNTNSPETSLLSSPTFPRLQQLSQVVSRLHAVAVGTVGG